VAALVSLTACGVQPEADVRGPPRLALLETSREFGPVKPGSEIVWEIPFENTGVAPLSVKASACCGCSADVRPAESIPPGGWGAVRVSCRVARAHLRKEVTVRSNDPGARVTRLSLTVGAPRPDPPPMDMGEVAIGDQVVRRVAVPRDVTAVAASNDRCRATLIRPGELEIALRGTVERARLRDRVWLFRGEEVADTLALRARMTGPGRAGSESASH
jgi:hypothetical protein